MFWSKADNFMDSVRYTVGVIKKWTITWGLLIGSVLLAQYCSRVTPSHNFLPEHKGLLVYPDLGQTINFIGDGFQYMALFTTPFLLFFIIFIILLAIMSYLFPARLIKNTWLKAWFESGISSASRVVEVWHQACAWVVSISIILLILFGVQAVITAQVPNIANIGNMLLIVLVYLSMTYLFMIGVVRIIKKISHGLFEKNRGS